MEQDLFPIVQLAGRTSWLFNTTDADSFFLVPSHSLCLQNVAKSHKCWVLTRTSSRASSARTSLSDSPGGTPSSLLSPAWQTLHFLSFPKTCKMHLSFFNTAFSKAKQTSPTPLKKQEYMYFSI